jgi:hypothetical protein
LRDDVWYDAAEGKESRSQFENKRRRARYVEVVAKHSIEYMRRSGGVTNR